MNANILQRGGTGSPCGGIWEVIKHITLQLPKVKVWQIKERIDETNNGVWITMEYNEAIY